jgi:integrase
VEKNFLNFVGWGPLISMANNLDPITRSLVSTTFETGGRATEVLSLKPEQFDIQKDKDIVMIQRMIVKKRRDKIRDRTFPILLSDPLTHYMLERVEQTEPRQCLFPYGYDWMYKKIRDIEKPRNMKHGPWWIHRFRAERATQLVLTNNFGVIELMRWFGWKRPDMPSFYVGLSPQDLVNKIRKGEL